MKYIYLSSLIIALSAFLFTGCDNADYKAQGNSLYIADAASTAKAATITMDGGADINVTVRLAQKLTEDVEVEIGFTPEILTSYNANNGTEYEVLPAKQLPQGATVTIPAGEISAIFQLHIDDFATNGITYAVPLTLGNVLKGNVTKSDAQGKFIYVLSKPLNVSVPVMQPRGTENVQTDPNTDWGVAVETYTLEAWVRMSYLSRNNQAIFNVRANNELYVRFGDANSPYNYLQVKAHGDGGTETARDWNTNQWYHIAIVYNGSELVIYRDGIRVVGKQVPAPKGGMIINGLQMISSSSQYFRAECAMSQVRLWNYARSQAEIQNNMFFEVNPKNPNLIGLWPLDEGEGNAFKDATGQGRDMTAGDGLVRRWEHDVRFDKK